MPIMNPTERNRFPEVEVDVGLAYECMQMLCAVCGADEHKDYEVENEWLEQIRERISPELRRAIEYVSGSLQDNDIWCDLTGIAYDCEAPRDVPTLIAHIEAMDALELHLYMLGYYSHSIGKFTSSEVALRAAKGDKDAQKQFLRAVKLGDVKRLRSTRRLLTLDAASLKSSVLEVLRRWYDEIFREQEAQILPILQRDADTKCELKSSVAPGRFIELATNGFEYIPEPFTRAVVLVPSFVMRPYVCDIEHHNVTIFVYPVADESLVEDSSAPPQRLVRLYKALADERRLRILKKLAAQAYSLQEMADEMGVAKTTLHHHFVILRSSGLVRLRTSDHRYRLREETFSDVSDLLEAYLKQERSL